MHLISCDNCSIVLDVENMGFEPVRYREDGSVDTDTALWNGRDYVPKTECPLCGHDICLPGD